MPYTASNKPPCPQCATTKSAIRDSREDKFRGAATIRRRRECKACGTRWTTYEITKADLLGWLDAPPPMLQAPQSGIFIQVSESHAPADEKQEAA